MTVSGSQFISPDGEPVILKGTNLGNWLLPEGYMFKFQKTNAAWMIDESFRQLVGPDQTDAFWQEYLDSYIKEDDIAFLKSIGANHIRVPFNYRLFTGEHYMGGQDLGFTYLDKVVDWSARHGLWVLLDMHAAPGGQTGDNIDDGYGYPYLFLDEDSQEQITEIWTRIADHYKNNTTVIGYDLLNEPIAHYFEDDFDVLLPELEPLYKKITESIREVDQDHIIFLGGAQWNTNFSVFSEPFDDKLAYEFHKYWMEVEVGAIQEYLDFRDTYNVPIYMGESGENTDEWVLEFRELLDEHEINWAFWPYKKMKNTRGIMNFEQPEEYAQIIEFTEGDRSTFKAIRTRRPDRDVSIEALKKFNTNSLYRNSFPNTGYIEALGFSVPANDESLTQ
tara:strand:+ start:298141 stop:299313 length:1173 start_codon:yes stop_codon:yes gene_type:complete